MGFSNAWEEIYQRNEQDAIWPWSHLISLAHHYGNLHEGMRVLELGCGAGANIPFFLSQKADYYGIDGSATTIARLQKRFEGQNVHLAQADFSKDVHYGGTFDLVIDRAAVTHNATVDIEQVIALAMNVLRPGGRYMGMDWFSTKYDDFTKEQAEEVDAHTRIFRTGYFVGMGAVHFSDKQHLRELFKGGKFLYLTEKIEQHHVPEEHQTAAWDFVVEKEE